MKALIISGSNRGLGKELEIQFNPLFDYVITVNRSGLMVSKGFEVMSHMSLSHYLNDVSAFDKMLQDIEFSEVFLINNAGTIGETALIGEMSFNSFNEDFIVNCEMPFKLTNSVLGLRGLAVVRILNVSSGVSIKPQPGWSFYSASKAFLNSLTRSVIVEQIDGKSDGRVVLCSSINPGPLNTDMQREIRILSIQRFPNLQRFINLYEKNGLRGPELVASKIKELYLSGVLFENEFLDFNSLEWL